MTISAYQIDGVIKAYAKQSRMKTRGSEQREARGDEKFEDVVTLSAGKGQEVFQVISYNLREVLSKARER